MALLRRLGGRSRALVMALAATAAAVGPGAGAAGTTTPATAAGTASAQDLARGTWSVFPAGPLQARSGQATIWTGKELIIWGGRSPASLASGLPDAMLANGAAYDPSTGRWHMLATGPLSAREGVAGVWAGGQAFLWGGYRPVMSGYDDYATGATYDAATGTWRLLPRAPISARRGASAFWTGHEVVVFGGQRPSPKVAPLGGATYDPATRTWSKLPTLPHTGPGTAISTASTWTGRELVAVVTYEKVTTVTNGYSISSRVVVASWSPGAKAWHVVYLSPAHSAQAQWAYSAQATWSGGEIILVGGSACLPGMNCPLSGATTAAFDLAERKWRPLGMAVAPGSTWSTSWTGQTLAVLAVGNTGTDAPFGSPEANQGQGPFTSIGAGAAFDPGDGTWYPLPAAPGGRLAAGSLTWNGEDLLLWGTTAGGRTTGAVLAPGRPSSDDGYVEGTVGPCVGPVGSEPRPGEVLAVAAAQGKRSMAVQFVESPFHYRFDLPPGRYTLEASNDVSRSVTVAAGRTYRLSLYSRCL